MFQSIIERAQHSVDEVISRYLTRVAVTVPFLVAIGFGTAAASVRLTQEYGSITAYSILAAAFAAAGLLVSVVIAAAGHSAVVPGAIPTPPPAEPIATEDAQAKAPPIDTDMILAALGAVGPAAAPVIARSVVRNLPLLLGLIVLAYLMLAQSPKTDAAATVAAAE